MRVLVVFVLLTGCAGLIPLPSVSEAGLIAGEARVTIEVDLGCRDIYDGRPRDRWWAGSGVIVAEFSVVTVGHAVLCAEGWPFALRLFSDNWSPQVRNATVAALDRDHDVARLVSAVPYNGAQRVSLAPVELDASTCITFAHPKPGRRCGMIREVSYRDVVQGGRVDIDATWPSYGGNSGGGIWDDQGNLIGLVTNRHSNPEDGGLGTSLWSLSVAR